MAKGNNQKGRLLHLASLFLRETDQDHGLTLREIATHLENQGIPAERKTLYDDFETLRQFGMDIVSAKEGRSTCYFLVSRRFELAELKLLVDSVQSARFLTEKKSGELIGKLEQLASRREAGQLRRQVYLSGRVKTMNESVYYNVDRIHSAIAANLQIRFQYFQWNAEKAPQLRHGGQWYQVSPWALTCESENYYLIAYDAQAGKIKHYRVDKMLHIAPWDAPREGKAAAEQLDLADYGNRLFGMFDGQQVQVTLEGADHLAGAIVDRFGRDIPMHPIDGHGFRAVVTVAVSQQFLGWIMGLGEEIKIVSPPAVVEEMREKLRRQTELYGGAQ